MNGRQKEIPADAVTPAGTKGTHRKTIIPRTGEGVKHESAHG